jgi:hypothetical protein
MTIARIRTLLAAEALAFAAAALVHAGILLAGYEHWRAAAAEGLIAAILIVGLLACTLRPASVRTASLIAQGLAFAGTLVGAFTIAIGVGPQSTGDYVFHAVIVVLLAAGLVAVFRKKG